MSNQTLVTYYIDPVACTACMICNRQLACMAIYDQGNKKAPIIDEAECIGCDLCLQVCPDDAIFIRGTDLEREQRVDALGQTWARNRVKV